MDLANVSIAALVFGQFLSVTGFNWPLFGLGLVVYVILLLISTTLSG